MQDFRDLDWPKRTDRLVIRPAVAADASATWPIRSTPAVTEWMTTISPDEATHAAHFRDDDRLAKTLVIELDGRVIGDLMIAVEDAWAQSEVKDRALGVQAELGWAVAPEYGRQGLATEAVRELLRICFEEMGLRRVTAECFAANERSWRLMERVGMRREAYAVKDSLHRELGWLDGLTYALLAEEWPTRR
jgi:RimJ/RimL family protein N-acetyltransferase